MDSSEISSSRCLQLISLSWEVDGKLHYGLILRDLLPANGHGLEFTAKLPVASSTMLSPPPTQPLLPTPSFPSPTDIFWVLGVCNFASNRNKNSQTDMSVVLPLLLLVLPGDGDLQGHLQIT